MSNHTSETMETQILRENQSRNESYTPEYQQGNSLQISNTRSNSSEIGTQTLTSSPTSVLVSTSNEEGSRGFWNSRCQEISKSLPLLTKTGCVASHSNLLSGYYKNTDAQQLSFKVSRFRKEPNRNLSMTSSPLYIPFPQERTGIDRTLPGKKMMTYKLNPTAPMKKVLREYCGATRYFYNRALDVCKKAKTTEGNPDYSVAYNWKYLKNEFIYKKQRKEWEGYIPSLIKQEAINDLKKSQDSAIASLKKGNITSFNLRFKSKKDNKDYFRIRKSGIKVLNVNGKVAFRFFERKTNKLLQKLTGCSIEDSKALSIMKTGIIWNDDDPLVITSDSTVCIDRRTQEFKLFTPIASEPSRQSKNQQIDIGVGQQKRQVVAIDPGVRSFVTTFDEHGDSIQVDPLEKILLKKERIRKIQRNIEALKTRNKTLNDSRLRFKILKLVKIKSYIEQKTKNRVKDMHYKLSSFLCQSYNTILLPEFGTQKMVGKNSVLRKRTKDRMLTLSHYKFRQILALKAKEFGTTLSIMGEEYTTKTCSLCGNINDNVGSSKVYRCTSNCNYIADRDVNGARNIFIKGVVELDFISSR